MLSARKYAPHRQRRLRSATLYPTELQARCYGINDLRVLRPFGFAYALHNRQTPEISRPKFAWATGSICIVEQRADFVHHKDDRLRKEFEKWAVLTYTNNRAVMSSMKRGALTQVSTV